NKTNEIMINASWGLGEAVVSGIVSPDEYIVDKETKKISEKHIAEEKTMVVKKDNGIGTVEVGVGTYIGHENIEKQCLSDEEVMVLADYGVKIEKMYGSFQDIEWAFDRDTKKLYILQSRPITTLKGVEEVEDIQEKEE